MSRVSVAERAKLSGILAGALVRGLSTGVSRSVFLRWRFFSAKTDRLVIAPQDLHTPDPTRAAEIYAGRFAFGGKVVVCDGRSPFETQAPSDDWAAGLLGFSWLRHLRAADSAITRANARALVDEWIALHGGWNAVSWRPDVLSRRIMSWLCHSPLLLTDADVTFYRRFLRSLTKQVRVLRRSLRSTRDGRQRLEAIIALAYASLCMAGQMRHLRGAMRQLSTELDVQILPDGGHISRNPEALIALLLDLLPLRQTCASRNITPPQPMLNAIDRMMPMMRFFRHGDGRFAQFNGMGPTQAELIATVLAYDDARGAPFTNATFSGYQRVVAGQAVLLVDTGKPPPIAMSHEAHAGCLSFEFSSGTQTLIINCGTPANNRETWRQLARATAAHSTVTFNDTSSCRFLESESFRRLMHGTPIIAGPTKVPLSRDDRIEATILQASHDGYADAFNIIHERQLTLRSDGLRLDGEDSFSPADGDTLPDSKADEFAVRFHLHPSVKAHRLSDGHGAMLTTANRDVWTFSAYENRVEIEESVYLAAPEGPRRTMQIVIFGHARKVNHVRWTISRAAATASPATGAKAETSQPELPL